MSKTLDDIDWEDEYGKMILGLRYTCPNYIKDEYTGEVKLHEHVSKEFKAAQYCMSVLRRRAESKASIIATTALKEYTERMRSVKWRLGNVDDLAVWIIEKRTGENRWKAKQPYNYLVEKIHDRAIRNKSMEYWSFKIDEYEGLFTNLMADAADDLEAAVAHFEEWRGNLLTVGHTISKFVFPLKITKKEYGNTSYYVGDKRDQEKMFQKLDSITIKCAGIEEEYEDRWGDNFLRTMFKYGTVGIDDSWGHVEHLGKGSRTNENDLYYTEDVSDDLTVVRLRSIHQTYTKKYLKSHVIRWLVLFAYKGELWKAEIPKTTDVLGMSKLELVKLPDAKVYATIGPREGGHLG